jgi:hypothetical protein
VTALSIDPTDKEVRDFIVLVSETGTGALPKLIRAAHQAGVEAERARAAAETTEEWGVAPAGQLHLGELFSTRAKAEANVEWLGQHNEEPFVLVRRTAVGPWEVQS